MSAHTMVDIACASFEPYYIYSIFQTLNIISCELSFSIANVVTAVARLKPYFRGKLARTYMSVCYIRNLEVSKVIK